jgi:hypothetical protein
MMIFATYADAPLKSPAIRYSAPSTFTTGLIAFPHFHSTPLRRRQISDFQL